MRSRDVQSRQLGAWLFAGLTAPLAQFAGGMAWLMVALVAGICLIACWLRGRTEVKLGKWLCLVEYIWLIYVLASMGRWITGSWSNGNIYPAVPLTLLALGAVSACRGSGMAARGGSAVFWLVALIYSGVVAAGVGRAELTELIEFDKKLDLRLVVVLLVPGLTAILPGDKSKLPLGALAGIGVFAVLLSILVTGSLSLSVALSVDTPLFEWVEGLSLAGTLQRFEALVSVSLTMGWFALVSFKLCVVGQLADNFKSGCYSKGTWVAAVAAGLAMLLQVPESPRVTTLGCVVLWVLVPAIVVIKGRNKKFENSKNNA